MGEDISVEICFAEGVRRIFVFLLCGTAEQALGSFGIPFYVIAFEENFAEQIFGVLVIVLHGAFEPMQSVEHLFRDIIAFEVQLTEHIFCNGVALLGGFGEILHRLFRIVVVAVTVEHKFSCTVLRPFVALVSVFDCSFIFVHRRRRRIGAFGFLDGRLTVRLDWLVCFLDLVCRQIQFHRLGYHHIFYGFEFLVLRQRYSFRLTFAVHLVCGFF